VTRRFIEAYFAPKAEIPRPVAIFVGVATAVFVLGGWCALTYGGLARTDFLPTPDSIVRAAIKFGADGTLFEHMWSSVQVIFIGFALSSVLAVPIGVLMGSFRIIQAAIEPLVNFIRYLPVTSMIPLLILWVGIGLEQKVAVIFIGTFFQQIVLIADVSARVPRDLVNVSYTLGATRRQVVTQVLIPATMPGVMDTLRVTMGWAWTYLVVAELVAANSGLGYLSLQAMRGLRVDVIFLAIFVIGLLGLLTDLGFRLLRELLLPWASLR
jgi:NitT/TauT family transport system permease protein